ncbi:hypothetical protein [Streptomyces sp. NPDC002132]|uniref:hypothetical protein n=1 Tax=unclassified Streptomyces TaxID=2593676 RepID=UPI00332B3387
MTGEQLALDCEPTWTDHQPANHTPTPFDVRQAEMWDLRNQGPGPYALWTARTIHAPEYL